LQRKKKLVTKRESKTMKGDGAVKKANQRREPNPALKGGKPLGKEMKIILTAGLILFVFWCILSSCARPRDVATKLYPGQEVRMRASDFRFEPSMIQVYRLGNLLIHVHNASSNEHNITIKDPQGAIVAHADLPPEETVTLEVELKAPGTYRFFCDKPFHPTLGMRGEIVAAPPARQ
jgi:plastocyanin